MEKTLEKYEPFVKRMARKFCYGRPKLDTDDFEQVGRLAVALIPDYPDKYVKKSIVNAMRTLDKATRRKKHAILTYARSLFEPIFENWGGSCKRLFLPISYRTKAGRMCLIF